LDGHGWLSLALVAFGSIAGFGELVQAYLYMRYYPQFGHGFSMIMANKQHLEDLGRTPANVFIWSHGPFIGRQYGV